MRFDSAWVWLTEQGFVINRYVAFRCLQDCEGSSIVLVESDLTFEKCLKIAKTSNSYTIIWVNYVYIYIQKLPAFHQTNNILENTSLVTPLHPNHDRHSEIPAFYQFWGFDALKPTVVFFGCGAFLLVVRRLVAQFFIQLNIVIMKSYLHIDIFFN